MRIHGRTLRASSIAERRLLRAIGVEALHVPRRDNPFRVARKIEQILRRQREEMTFLHGLAKTNLKTREPRPSPDVDLPEQDHEADDAVGA